MTKHEQCRPPSTSTVAMLPIPVWCVEWIQLSRHEERVVALLASIVVLSSVMLRFPS